MEQTKEYIQTWDLDQIFTGGSQSLSLKETISKLTKEISKVDESIELFNPAKASANDLVVILNQLGPLQKQLRDVFAYIGCLSAQDVNDSDAAVLVAKSGDLAAKMGTVSSKLNQKLKDIKEEAWAQTMQSQELKEIAFSLSEARRKAKEMLPIDQEVLINDLAVDGYHAWNQMYDTIVGSMFVTVEEKGESKQYSMGQASNMMSNSDHHVRKKTFDLIQQEWQRNAPLFGQSLNHLAGFRLQIYKHRGWNDVLREPLENNRMQKETLDAMWTAIEQNKEPFVAFLNRKAKLLGVEKLSMYDIGAPLGKSETKVSYTQGANRIIEQFQKFSPQMADFAKMAFENRWIEAEDRAGKRPGGFCTSFPNKKQTRIFMTYSGTESNIATLAHELGHGFHQHVMNDLPIQNQRYAMNVAETASTFAEMILADAAVRQATSKEEKVALLEDKIRRGITFFMNIHARFLFETNFYEERKNGMVPVERLNELMVTAQKEAYCDALDEYDPMFWASKLHFHKTGTPFYNFPYTFGYLFSLGIYAHALEQGNDFENEYIALLQDTGRMTVEDLAKKHLNVDLTKPDFWEKAIHLCIEDINEFMQLTE
ncbi:M3 family oligoendopeptidase [Rummeliibacillus stabekisii]|uniref:M3 family oligoendopeptidase n=1 Tax=Rummeliibacillus stabekisii TaxID=241244 RepID=UPI00116B5BC8|nr:M3 family oligoendopeptidase [Rummeliibacillus stabekisii]MBB5170992.1 pepF/M3 family oligoendopeptidase [Rummeliibacillus stabekisii]GEL05354.1 oligoendopeptidase [Rummeliibacillus stabekisii]